MKYRTNFAVLAMIHQHMILFMKCHFLGSGELCMNLIHIGLNWLSKVAFIATIYVCKSVFSVLGHIKT